MKKESIFRTLRFALLCALFIPFVGCKESTDEPDGPNTPDEPGVVETTTSADKLNANLASLQKIIANLGEDDLATSLKTLTEGDVQVGYTIHFLQNSPVNIYVLDGNMPTISAKKDADQYYWTLDGDTQGNQYAVADVLPQTQLNEGNWQISWDGGKTWSDVVAAENKINVSQNEDWILVPFNGETIFLPKNAALGCTFEVAFNNINSSSALVTVTPSENDVYYYWNLYEMDDTEEEIKDFIQTEIEYYGGFPEKYTAPEYWSLSVVQGVTTNRVKNLQPNTSYKILVVAIDMTTGNYAGEFNWFEFTTTDRIPGEKTSIFIECPYYFDGMDFYEVGGAGFKHIKDMCYAVFEVTTEGAPIKYRWTLAPLTQAELDMLSNEAIVATLLDENPSIQENKEIYEYWFDWEPEYALLGVAEGADGNYYLYKKIMKFTPSGASDIRLVFPRKQDTGETSVSVVPKSKVAKFNKDASQVLPLIK